MNPDDENNPDQEDLNRPSVGGRPPKYETTEELQEAVDGYFNGGMKKRAVVVGKADDREVVYIPSPTITGLVLYLGFADRHSFYDLEKDEKFSHTIKRARTFIENEYEEILRLTGNAGAIFALKNFGWRDERQLALSDDTRETSDKIKGFMDGEDELDEPDLPDDSTPPTPEASEEA